MNEKNTKRKEWVKTAAIVFLSVMLVLTFFSNTFMNYSLPEVAVQYIEPGSITAQIRGNGVVESGDPYNVKVSGTRKVESIHVNVGDTVEKGAVLMQLSSEDSEALKAAKAELKAAEMAFELALLTGNVDTSVMQNAGNTLSMETYRTQIISLKNQIALAEKDVEAAQKDVDELTQWGNALSTQIAATPSNTADTSAEEKAVAEAEKKLDAAQLELTEAQNKLDEIERKIDYEMSVSDGDNDLEVLEKDKITAQKTVLDKTTARNDAQVSLTKAQNNLNQKIASGDTSGTIANLTGQKNNNDIALFHAQNVLNEKQKVLAKQEELLAEYVKNTSDSINLSTQYQTVLDAMDKVSELESQVAGSEVTAPIAGTITAINVSSGLDTPADGIVVLMQPEGAGYTKSFSVTNEQARKVNVGEPASLVNSWRYNDLSVVLKKIMPDTSNHSQNKRLVFEVSGEDVVAGQSINVSVGQKSSNYDMLVPNSAIREDNNGKFILIVQAKSSPLGNRYIASRVDVEVIASDDTKSAITGAVNSYEYVITTANKPVAAGEYVRLPEN